MRFAASLSLALLFLTACASKPPQSTQAPPPVQPNAPLQVADLAVINADIVTMEEGRPRAQALAVSGGKIVAVGSTADIKPLIGPNTTVYDQPGAVLPGFIDGHSHTAGFAFFNNPEAWVDVSSINMFFKPPPTDSRCTTPNDPQFCFIPVKNHTEVLERLKKRLVDIETGRSKMRAVLAFNYDPARLGNNPPRCQKGSVGFQCQNFENGTAIAQLDALSTSIPIYIASESGHISYVNTPALKLLEICGTFKFMPPGCKEPTMNVDEETKLAKLGQLDEDLSLRATSYFMNEFAMKGEKGLAGKLLYDGAMIYANHGFTMVQEGAADLVLAGLWFEQLRPGQSGKPFPVAAALVMYDVSSPDFNKTIDAGKAAKLLIGEKNPLLHVAALKSFADGSPQGFTANLKSRYLNLYQPFTNPQIFNQPYTGLPDVDGRDLLLRLNAAHAAGFPMVIHQNGDKSITEAVDAILAASRPPSGKRDVVLHAPMITAAQLEALGKRGDVVASFLIQNVHFWGLPECHQVLGLKDVVNMYPIRTAKQAKVRATLHSDSPVTTPYPLFEAWVAKTRRVQEMPWYAPYAKGCPRVLIDNALPPGDQSVSIADSLRALTIDAAWQYGMEDIRGSIAVGKYADLVMLSADPTTMESDPDKLKTVQVLRTVRYGEVIENPRGNEPPIWPGD